MSFVIQAIRKPAASSSSFPLPPLPVVLILLLMFLAAAPLRALVINVPGDHATIQSAINAADNGDEIIVAPGLYKENLQFTGKSFILRSTEPTSPTVVAATIIDGDEQGRVITLRGGEKSPDSAILGFTIRNGRAPTGGGLLGNNSRSRVAHCVFEHNTAYDGDGGAVAYQWANFEDCIFRYNHASSRGGGVFYVQTMKDCLITSNSATYGGGAALVTTFEALDHCVISKNEALEDGGGAYHVWNLYHCRVEGNKARNGGGIYKSYDVLNCLVVKNHAEETGGGTHTVDRIGYSTVYNNSSGHGGVGGVYWSGRVFSSIVWNNSHMNASENTHALRSVIDVYWHYNEEFVDDNIPFDPRLVDPENGNYRLRADSPCLDAGDRSSSDLDGNLRPYDAVPPFQEIFAAQYYNDYDIGAYEFIGTGAPNQPPGKPAAISPLDGALVDSLYFTVSASPFSDPDTDDNHWGTSWLVSENDAFTSGVFYMHGGHRNKTTVSIPPNILEPERTYYWRVRYRDDRLTWGEWSDTYSFITPDINDLFILY